MRDKDAHLMMEGLYKEAGETGPPPGFDPIAAYKAGHAAPVNWYGQTEHPTNLIPYNILGQLQQDLEEMWTTGGKDAARATTQSGQSIQQVVSDMVSMAVTQAGTYVAKNPDPTGSGAAEVA